MAHRRRTPPGGTHEAPGARLRRIGGVLGTCLAASAVGALVLPPTPAGAQSFGPSGCCYYADNSIETYYYSNLTLGDINAMEVARWNKLEATDMTTQLHSSSNNDTDLIVYDDNYSNETWSGRWQCDLLVSGSSTKCNRGRITFNLRFGNANYALACQEQGHGIGLDHSSSTGSCMYQNSSVAASDYDTHDKGHINGYY